MKKIHVVIGGKGGCGKTHVSCVITQYLQAKYKNQVDVFDTDQVNPNLYEYAELAVEHISLLDSNNNFNNRKFDDLFEKLINSEKKHIVVDTGSNTYMPLLEYAKSINLFQQLEDFDCEIIFHLILGGGDMYETTLAGIESVLGAFKVKSVIWLNEHFGAIENFETASVFQAKNPSNAFVIGAMLLPKYDKDTFGEDLKVMSTKRLTLEQALAHPDFKTMSRIRLRKVYADYFSRLDSLEMFSNIESE